MEAPAQTRAAQFKRPAPPPAGLAVEVGHLLRCFPQAVVGFLAALVMSVLVALFVHPVLWVLVLVDVALAVVVILRVKEHFRTGTVHPGCVLSLSPPLVAVYGDLGTGEVYHPFIKIVHPPLEKMGPMRPRVGMRVPMVCTFTGGGRELRRDDVIPVPAACATRSRGVLEKLLESIPAWEWVALHEGLTQIPRPYHKGLHRIDPRWLEKPVHAISGGLDRTGGRPDRSVAIGAEADFEGILTRLRPVFPNLEVRGAETAWREIVFPGSRGVLRARSLQPREGSTDFEDLMASITETMQGIRTAGYDNKQAILRKITAAKFAVEFTADATFQEEDGHFYAITQTAAQLQGLVFNGSGMLDPQGRVLLNEDGTWDVM